jgi:membrane protein implicated in regulation of membrane protease activity
LIILGIILMIAGFFLNMSILWMIGIVLVIAGVVLAVAGSRVARSAAAGITTRSGRGRGRVYGGRSPH